MTVKEKITARMTRRELIKPVAIGFCGLAFRHLFEKTAYAQTENTLTTRRVPGNLPPIIIKSGPITIESDEPLIESVGGGYSYKRPRFKLIQAVRVIKINEHTGMTEIFPFVDIKGVELDIRLQFFVSNRWEPIADGQIVQIKNEPVAGSSNFVLSTTKKLDKKEKKPRPGRRERREDKDNDIFRFGSVVIRGKGTVPPPPIPPTVEGDEYIIGLYNYYTESLA